MNIPDVSPEKILEQMQKIFYVDDFVVQQDRGYGSSAAEAALQAAEARAQMNSIFCSGICIPHRGCGCVFDEEHRKHVESRVVEPKALPAAPSE